MFQLSNTTAKRRNSNKEGMSISSLWKAMSAGADTCCLTKTKLQSTFNTAPVFQLGSVGKNLNFLVKKSKKNLVMKILVSCCVHEDQGLYPPGCSWKSNNVWSWQSGSRLVGETEGKHVFSPASYESILFVCLSANMFRLLSFAQLCETNSPQTTSS